MNKKIAELVNQIGEIQQKIKEQEERTASLKTKLHMLRTRDLPNAMLEVGLVTMETDYYSCELKLQVRGSLPKPEEQREAAIEYIREMGAEDMIKSELSISFPRGDEATARRLKRLLITKTNQPILVETTVNHMTLAAWARERIVTGQPLDLTKVGIYVENIANIKRKD